MGVIDIKNFIHRHTHTFVTIVYSFEANQSRTIKVKITTNVKMRLNCLVLCQIFSQVRSWTYVDPTPYDEFPLGIVYLEIQYSRIKNTCSGSVIGNKTIITAAHCVDNDPKTITIHLNKGYGARNFTDCKQNRDKLWSETDDECVERFINLKDGNHDHSSV